MLCCIVLCCIVLCCVVLCCVVLCCVVLCCIVLYCIVLYCIVLCCIVLYCIVLYCTVLCCTVLYFIVYCILYIVLNFKSSALSLETLISSYSSYVIYSLQTSNTSLFSASLFYSILAFFSYIFLGEKFGPQGYFGTALILAGVWYSANGGNGKEMEKVEAKELILLSQKSILSKEKTEN